MKKTALSFLGILLALMLMAANPMPGITNVERSVNDTHNGKPALCYHPVLQKYVLCNRGNTKNQSEPALGGPKAPEYRISGGFIKPSGLNKFFYYRNAGRLRGFFWYQNVGSVRNQFDCKFSYQF